jgi:hypothetical protein
MSDTGTTSITPLHHDYYDDLKPSPPSPLALSAPPGVVGGLSASSPTRSHSTCRSRARRRRKMRPDAQSRARRVSNHGLGCVKTSSVHEPCLSTSPTSSPPTPQWGAILMKSLFACSSWGLRKRRCSLSGYLSVNPIILRQRKHLDLQCVLTSSPPRWPPTNPPIQALRTNPPPCAPVERPAGTMANSTGKEEGQEDLAAA